MDFDYVIAGGGLAGMSAAEEIFSIDPAGRMLMLLGETELPYDRPPLSKGLWTGKTAVSEIFLHQEDFFIGITLARGVRAAKIDPAAKTLQASDGSVYGFKKLLIATGSTPRKLSVPGGDAAGIIYFRTLDDYRRLRRQAEAGKSALVIGGGFIGSEIAAALAMNGLDVTVLFPGNYFCQRVFPPALGKAINELYRRKGVKILAGQKLSAIEEADGGFLARLQDGKAIAADIVVAGIGVAPETALAEIAGLQVDDGIVVDEFLQTSQPGIYAAGDNARFPCKALGQKMRFEHWDNAIEQGKCAGRNMAGENSPYTHLPFFFSDLFEFGYEAVGEVDSRLEVRCDWSRENEEGIVYYLSDGKVRGVLLCNVWGKVDEARELVKSGARNFRIDLT